MRHLLALRHHHRRISRPPTPAPLHRSAHYKPQKTQPPPSPPTPPKPPQKPTSFTLHHHTWWDPYSWMSSLNDKVAMRHMDVYMEQEEKYTEAVMFDTERLQSKLQSEMASRMASHLSTPPLRWGPWGIFVHIPSLFVCLDGNEGFEVARNSESKVGITAANGFSSNSNKLDYVSNASNSNLRALDWNFNGLNSNSGPIDGKEEIEDDDGDDGWEFKVAYLEAKVGDGYRTQREGIESVEEQHLSVRWWYY